jgi:hypothetical protein
MRAFVRSKVRSCVALFAALSWLLISSSCTITPDGIQQAEVPMEEIFPPSKTVASYRQLKKPAKPSEGELESECGGATKVSVIRKWGVLSSLTAQYGIPERPPKAQVTVVEISSKHNAYGAYTNVRPGLLKETNYVKVGVHGTIDNDRLVFVQDRFVIFVRDLSDATESARRTLLINFGRAISDRIPRDITDIEVVSYLPPENRVPATERLDKEDPLGLGLMKAGGMTALYRIDNRECKVFMGQAETAGAAKDLMKDIRHALEKEAPLTELGIGLEGCQGRLFKSPAMLARRDLVVFGCYGTMTEKEMRNIMANIDRRVKPYVAPKVKARQPTEDEDETKKK